LEIRDNARSATINYLRPGKGGDWHYYAVSAKTPGFRAEFEVDSWRRSDFEQFQTKIQEMHETLSGEARLKSMEGEVTLAAGMDKLGHVIWTIILRDPSGPQMTEMSFEIENDQTALPKIASEIVNLVRPWQ